MTPEKRTQLIKIVALLVAFILSVILAKTLGGFVAVLLAFAAGIMLVTWKPWTFFVLFLSFSVQAQVKNWYVSEDPTSPYLQVTDQVIAEFQATTPELFRALDTLGLPILVKVMDSRDMQPVASGLTRVTRTAVLVKIAAGNRAERTLAHEFGHALYQVLHPGYIAFYLARYEGRRDPVLGHDSDDLSGKSAMEFEKRYVEAFKKRKDDLRKRV